MMRNILREKAYYHGIHPLDASWLCAAALAAAFTLSRRELSGSSGPKSLLKSLAFEIEGQDRNDARFATAMWLRNVTLDAYAGRLVDTIIQDFLPADLTGQERMELATSVLEAVIDQGGYDIATAVHERICSTVPTEHGSRVACLYPLSAPAALRLSARCNVTLYCGNTVISVLTALLAHAVSGKLKVDRRDPVMGSHHQPHLGSSSASAVVVGNYDHVVTVPPLGWSGSVVTPDPDRAFTLEGRQFGYFKRKWRRSFTTIVSHTLVDAAAPKVGLARLFSHGGVVKAWELPPAVWGRDSFARTSLLHLTAASHETSTSERFHQYK